MFPCRAIRALIAAAWLFLAAAPCLADQAEVFQIKPTVAFPDAVCASDEAVQPCSPRLSLAPVAEIRAFYAARLRAGERIEDVTTRDGVGFKVIQQGVVAGKMEEAALLTVTRKTEEDRNVTKSLEELQGLAQRGIRPRAEYEAARQTYAAAAMSYFPSAAGPDGGHGDLAAQHYNSCRRRAHADDPKPAKPTAEDKERAKEIKQKMRELRAAGDIAGMMQYAGSVQPPQAAGGNMAAAQTLMAKDTWDIWASCLEAMRKAAYPTKIVYPAGAIR